MGFPENGLQTWQQQKQKNSNNKKNSWGACYADFGLYTPDIDLKGQGALESAFSSSSLGDYKYIWSTVHTLKKPLPKTKDHLSTMEINMFFIPAKTRVLEQKGRNFTFILLNLITLDDSQLIILMETICLAVSKTVSTGVIKPH